MAVAAVHQACETLAQLTQTEWEQINAAAQVGRILVPTSALSGDYDVARPFARAPRDRVEQLLAAKLTGHALEADTAGWIADLEPLMADKLARVGLIPSREPQAAATLGPF